MCREALKGYLEGCETGLATDAIAAFVDARETDGISPAHAPSVAAALESVTVVDPACGSGAYLLGMMQELVDLRTALFNVGVDAKSLYDLKLHVIQRNLYGVDVDEFAANIAMLRLWLSLAIEYDGPVDKLDPLPNLDFKIVRGDSLLGPDPSPDSYGDLFRFKARDLAERLTKLKGEHMKETSASKFALKAEIESAQAELRAALGDAAAPEAAVDWRVEFAEVFAQRGGFDVAIANPPYIQLQKDGGKLRRLYGGVGYTTLDNRGDIYQLFYERGCQLLQPSHGLLAYITSNSWLKAEYGKKLRRYIAEHHLPLKLLELGKEVFESAIVDTSVLLLRTGCVSGAFPAVDVDRLSNADFPPASARWGRVRPDGDAQWSVMSVLEQSAMDKMLANGTPLGAWDVRIYYGIKTGYNQAFIIDQSSRDMLVAQDPESADIIKPVLRGRDIQRYRAKWAGRWLIDTHNGHGDVPAIEIDNYTTVKAHLEGFYTLLERRYDKGKTPYNLRSCAYHEEFAKQKLLWRRVASQGMFSYEEKEVFCVNAGCMIVGDSLKYLCAILNATASAWFSQRSFPTSGTGTFHWEIVHVERIPIPRIGAQEQAQFVRLVDAILEAKDADPNADTSHLEWQIDGMVFDALGLTAEERLAVHEGVTESVTNRKQKSKSLLEGPHNIEIKGQTADAVGRNIVTRGQSIYDEKIRHKVEDSERGKFAVIDVYSEDYEIDARHADASRRLVARHPGAITYPVRIGQPTAYKFGFRSRLRTP